MIAFPFWLGIEAVTYFSSFMVWLVEFNDYTHVLVAIVEDEPFNIIATAE